jgi:hypothetical protein
MYLIKTEVGAHYIEADSVKDALKYINPEMGDFEVIHVKSAHYQHGRPDDDYVKELEEENKKLSQKLMDIESDRMRMIHQLTAPNHQGEGA